MNSNDGTTAVQVSPIPTESEMTRIRQIFEYAANAIVRASELGKQVTELEGRFKTLENDHTQVLARNDELVKSLAEIRSSRDLSYAEHGHTKNELSQAQSEIRKLNSEADYSMNKINGLEEELRTVKADRDDAYKAWHEAQDRADDAETKLKAIHKTLGIPEPKTEVAPQAEPIPQAMPTVEVVANPEPRPLTEPDLSAVRSEATQGPSDADFNRPYHYDSMLNRYVND